MLKIRLSRVGRKHEPKFRLVLTDSKNAAKSGKFLEILGSYDPREDKPVFKSEKIMEWVGKGAKVSDTVHNLLVKEKVISGKKINVLPKKSPIVKDGGDKAETSPKGEKPTPEAEAEVKPEIKDEVVEETAPQKEEVKEVIEEGKTKIEEEGVKPS